MSLLSSRPAEPGLAADSPLKLGSHTLASRLIVGTGKYKTFDLMRNCLEASGSDVITVAVRRERLIDAEGRNILDYIDLDRYTILPNTAGCFTAEDAVRVARLGREILSGLENPGADWVKLEVLGDKKTLLPDPIATLQATEALVKDGFQVLVYTTDDPITARRLKEAGATSVMPRQSNRQRARGAECQQYPICIEYLKENDPITRSLLTQESARPATCLRRWSWAAMVCCSTRRLPPPMIRCGWPLQ